jgi:hypothetical protein
MLQSRYTEFFLICTQSIILVLLINMIIFNEIDFTIIAILCCIQFNIIILYVKILRLNHEISLNQISQLNQIL